MMTDEGVEIRESGENYELVPIRPIRALESRVAALESASISAGVPQIQSLIGQIIELIKTNQKLIDEIVRADNELREALAKIPPRIEELVYQLKHFMELLHRAGEMETTPGISTEAMKPVLESMQKMIELNQKIVDTNQSILESLDSLNRKLKSGTPVSSLMSQYPGLKLRSSQV